MTKTKQISAHIPEEERAYVERLAKENLRSFSAQLVMIIREHRDGKKPVYRGKDAA